jgi:pantoate kinase
MSKIDVLLGRVDETAQEPEKRAAEDGLLEAFYQEAEKIAEEAGLDKDEALKIADKVMETKVARYAMVGEVNRIQEARDVAASYDPRLEIAASYAPIESGPYAGILHSIQNRQQ